MKALFAFLALLVSLSVSAQQIITSTVTFTNVAGTANGETITVNGNLRTFTNYTSSALILTGTNIQSATSNAFLAFASFSETGVAIARLSTNAIVFSSYPGVALSVSISAGWGTVSLATNTLTVATLVRVPPSAVGSVESSNVTAGLSSYLNVWTVYPTNNTPTNLTAPSGSLCVTTNGRLYVRSNAAWIPH